MAQQQMYGGPGGMPMNMAAMGGMNAQQFAAMRNNVAMRQAGMPHNMQQQHLAQQGQHQNPHHAVSFKAARFS